MSWRMTCFLIKSISNLINKPTFATNQLLVGPISYVANRGTKSNETDYADEEGDSGAAVIVSDHHLASWEEEGEDRDHNDDAVPSGYCRAKLIDFALIVLCLGFVAAVAFPVGCYLRVKGVSRQIAEERERKRAQRRRRDLEGADNGGFSTIESESRFDN